MVLFQGIFLHHKVFPIQRSKMIKDMASYEIWREMLRLKRSQPQLLALGPKNPWVSDGHSVAKLYRFSRASKHSISDFVTFFLAATSFASFTPSSAKFSDAGCPAQL